MTVVRQNRYLAWLILHFLLVATVCVHETLWLLKTRVVALSVPARIWENLDVVPAAILGDGPSLRTPWQKVIACYTNVAGIETGYGYFAPNIPGTNALVFECHYPNGRVDYQTPTVESEAAQLRLTTLIEQIGRTDYEQWRVELIKLLAHSTWRRHPDAVSVRAFFGSVTPPSVADYHAGKRERVFNCLNVYQFDREVSTNGESSK